jgi:hypothetical protein
VSVQRAVWASQSTGAAQNGDPQTRSKVQRIPDPVEPRHPTATRPPPLPKDLGSSSRRRPCTIDPDPTTISKPCAQGQSTAIYSQRIPDDRKSTPAFMSSGLIFTPRYASRISGASAQTIS